MLGTKEHYELIDQFDRQFKHCRLDKEKDRGLWVKGNVYQDGHVNDLYAAFFKGYAFGKFVARDEPTAEESSGVAAPAAPEVPSDQWRIALRELLSIAETVTPQLKFSAAYRTGRWGQAISAARAAMAAPTPQEPRK